MEETDFLIRVERLEGYQFRVSFDHGIEDLLTSEPPPLGEGNHPNAGQLMAAALGNCMCASLLYCLERSRVEVGSVNAEVTTRLERNREGRFRLTRMRLVIRPEVEDGPKVRRCVDLFREYCVVGKSIEEGISTEVEVEIPENGT
ncbi:MAG: OsmC family protein [Methanomassiliicoccales archaeon]